MSRPRRGRYHPRHVRRGAGAFTGLLAGWRGIAAGTGILAGLAFGLAAAGIPFAPEAEPPPGSPGPALAGRDREASEPPVGSPGPREEPGPFRVAAFGDVMLADRVAEAWGSVPDRPWRDVAPWLAAADLALGNFEGASGRVGEPEPKAYTFRVPVEAIPVLARAGIDVMSLANNHSGDFGPLALLETRALLEAAGVAVIGAGSGPAEAWKPVEIQGTGGLQGLSAGVIAASRVLPRPEWAVADGRPGIASAYDPGRLLREVQALAERVDLVVVSLHWGEELAAEPRPEDRELAHRLIEAGADLVLGHHPHRWQGIEWHRGGLVAYSLGNFVFSRGRDPSTWESALLEVSWAEGRIAEARLRPVRLEPYWPRPAGREEAAAWLDGLDRLSQPLGVRVGSDGTLRWVEEGPRRPVDRRPSSYPPDFP